MTKESNKERIERLKNIVLSMPELPGSYQYYDSEGTIIYVGKAKNLKRRVSSYFHKEVDRYKTAVLVSKIQDITYTVVKTEEDALLLENALIKKYNPRYNILLKDGKTYPSIVITNEPFPRIFKTRNMPFSDTRRNRQYGQFFGPYTNIGAMMAVLEFIRKVYKPRSCRQPITLQGIAEGRYKPCLEYHIHNCGGCCVNRQSYEDYQENMRAAREILRGNTRSVLQHLWDAMMKASDELRFEDAQAIKEQYQLVEQFCAKSEVVSHTITDVDVFTCLCDDSNGNAYVNYLHINNGQINQSFTFEYKRRLEESEEEILSSAIPEIRERFASTSKEIIVPKMLDWKLSDAEFFVPQRGEKAHLLELSMMNCKQYRVDRLKQSEKLNPEQRATRLMTELKQKLGLPKLPYHIEAFDNSNIQGSDAVAGCVVFKGMKPSKRDYTRYNIKTVDGPDDYASMQEIVRRRYTRFIDEDKPLPDLIVCDGGIGQMHCVREVIEDELHLSIPIAGLAKDDRHRTNELLYGFPPVVVGLKTDSELFHVLTQLQDEVHRYAITFHREKRSKSALHSQLDDIKGIGEKSKNLLLKQLKTVKAIRTASLDDLTAILGPSKAKIIHEYFQK